MLLKRLEISNVRNLKSVSIDLEPGLNLFVGDNGAGKTAVLEAVHLLLRGRSFRSTRVRSVIRRGSDSLSVFASGTAANRGRVAVGVSKDRHNRTELRVNGEPVRQASSVASLLPVQIMLPDLSELVFGGPEHRRQWIDWGTFHVEPTYLATLRGYTRALRQRNVLLKREQRRELTAWTEQLADLGTRVHASRVAYLQQTLRSVDGVLQVLAPALAVAFDYVPGFRGPTLREALAEGLESDVKSGVTRAGPHRADLKIVCDGEPASGVLSRGQGKVVASALRLGQAMALRSEQAQGSLFLIDDIGAELDELNNTKFFDVLESLDAQILATTTDLDAFRNVFPRDRVRVFHVKHGEIRDDSRPQGGDI